VLKNFLEDMMQDCPYKGRVEALNKTMGSLDGFLDLYPTRPNGDYKFITSTFDGEHSNQSIFEIHMIANLKARSLARGIGKKLPAK
jgi:hypothetical protein